MAPSSVFKLSPGVIGRGNRFLPPSGDPERSRGVPGGLRRLLEELEGKGVVLVEEIKLSIEPLFSLDPDRSSPGPEAFDEVKLFLVSNRAVFSEETTGLDREDSIEIHFGRQGAVKIDGASRLPLESSVESAKKPLEETISFLPRTDLFKTHLFDEPIL